MEKTTQNADSEPARRYQRQIGEMLSERDPRDENAPVWLRYPKPPARCPVTNASRSTLYEWTVACAANNYRPYVRSVVIKKPGAVRGIRLIHRQSLLDFLDRLSREQEAAANRRGGDPA